jgi:hypothetical protein
MVADLGAQRQIASLAHGADALRCSVVRGVNKSP